MLSQKRQKQIFEFIKAQKSAQVTELSKVFEISLSTVRRDLREMEEEGLVDRVHGGATLAVNGNDNHYESSILMRASYHSAEKERIAKAASDLVQDGETIIITSGTTTEAMLPHLADKQNLTVITNAITIAYKLGQYPQIEVIVLGGWLRHSEYSLLGHIAIQALQDLQVNKVFHGTYGIDPNNGLTGTFLPEVQTDRAIIASARDFIVLADSSKFKQMGPVLLTPIMDITTLITDIGISDADYEVLDAEGVEVIRV